MTHPVPPGPGTPIPARQPAPPRPPQRLDPLVPPVLRWANPPQLTPAFPLRPRWSIVDVLVAAIAFVVVPIAVALTLQGLVRSTPIDDGLDVFLSLLLVWVVLLGSCLVCSRTRGFGSLARDFGLRFRWIDLLTGFLASIGLRIVTVIVAVIVVALTGGQNTPVESNGDLFLAGSSTIWLIVNAGIGATLVSPLLEELFFRGLVLRAVQNRVWLGRWKNQPPAGGTARVRPATVKRPLVTASVVGALVSALLFSAAHLGQLTDLRSVLIQTLAIFCVGIVNAGLTLWFGRLGPAVITHICFNGTSLGLALLLQAAGIA